MFPCHRHVHSAADTIENTVHCRRCVSLGSRPYSPAGTLKNTGPIVCIR